MVASGTEVVDYKCTGQGNISAITKEGLKTTFKTADFVENGDEI